VRPTTRTVAVLATALVVAVCAGPGRAEAPKLGASVTFADATALAAYRAYVAFLAADPERFDRELATLSRLERSDVQYVVRVGGDFAFGVEGDLTTDGVRVFVTVPNEGGAFGETASLNSRLAHELEHARQFDEGEVAFVRDAKTLRWQPSYTSYDIGDEVAAWEAQLRASTPRDFWRVTDRKRAPTLLQLFSAAGTAERRVAVLRSHGYADRNPVAGSDVAFFDTSGVAVGDVLRPTAERQFFGRVRRVYHNPSA
jgi:hypothetical protein